MFFASGHVILEKICNVKQVFDVDTQMLVQKEREILGTSVNSLLRMTEAISGALETVIERPMSEQKLNNHEQGIVVALSWGESKDII